MIFFCHTVIIALIYFFFVALTSKFHVFGSHNGGRTFFGVGQRQDKKATLVVVSATLYCAALGNCKVRLMRPLAIGVDILSAVVIAASNSLSYFGAYDGPL